MVAPSSIVGGQVGRIPTYGTSFLGRQADLTRLSRWLEGGERLITVMGMSGIGKTRLVHRAALDRQHERIVMFCELAAVRTLDEVLSSLAFALDLPLQGSTDRETTIERVGEGLSHLGPALIILDNFEQLDSAVARVLPRWLSGAPEAQLIVTSRRRLGVRGERCFNLEPLPLEEALDLFCERSQRTAAEIADRNTLVALVESLDRLPLALELAASRTMILSPIQILERLEHRFDVLRNTNLPPNERHSSLERAISFSWELLDGKEQSCLSQSSIFHDGFDAEAAEQIIGYDGTAPILDILERLLESSFLHTYTASADAPHIRFTMYESIRAFASARLVESGKSGDVGARHSEYFLRIGEQWLDGVNGPEASRCRSLLAADQSNLLAVYRRSGLSSAENVARSALILSPVLSSFGPASTHAEVLDGGVKASRQVSPEKHCNLLTTRGWAKLHRGRAQEALVDLLAALDKARECQALLLEGDILAKLGHLHIRLGQLAKARTYTERSLQVCDENNLTSIRGQVLERQGLLLFLEGSFEEAERSFDRALELHRLNDDHLWQGFSHCDRGEVRMHRGRTTLAIEDFNKALDFQNEVGDQRLMGVVELCLGLIRHEQGDHSRARSHYRHAIDALRRASHRKVEAEALEAWGQLELLSGNNREAQAKLAEALEILRALGNQSGEARLEATLALCQAFDGQIELARKALEGLKKEELEESSSREIIELISATVEIEGAGQSLASGHEADIPRWLSAAKQRINAVEPTTMQHRIAASLYMARLERYGFDVASEESAPASIIFGPECRWFSLPGGEQVSLARRGAMRLLLKTLVKNRLDNPGATLDAYELFEHGWPCQDIMPDVGAARVYESIRVLRKLGLSELLLYQDGGYLIDPEKKIEVS